MKGYFYAADSAATVHGAMFPSGFQTNDESGQLAPISSLTLRSTSGVWLTSPVMSEPDENGDQTVVDAGVRSDPYVVVSSMPIGLLDAYLIQPEGETLA